LKSCRAMKSQILALLGNRQLRMTPSDLERELCQGCSQSPKKEIRSLIKAMVAEGSLRYTNHFNTTHLELNYDRPIQVSERIILSPPTDSRTDSDPNALCIKIDPGSAFGIGDHPTTRLSLRGVDIVMNDALKKRCWDRVQALDIGTGSAVLAMAAVGLGAASAVGIDIDPTALHEAGKNIQLNGMAHKIKLTTDSLESLGDSIYSLVMANLRPPTLKRLLPVIEKVSTPEAFWVFSGCREEALERMTAILPKKRAEIFWKAKSCGWAALAARYERR